MALVDLPEVTFVDDSVTAYLNQSVTVMEGLLNRKLYPGDPVRLFLQTQAVLVVQLLALVNKTARMNLLRYASGPVLDNIGAFTETPRLPASAAITALRFTLSSVQPTAVVIPGGTRVSTQSDPKVYFATTETQSIPAGTLYLDILARCTETGAAGNGYLAGQINQVVDPLPFVASASNTMTTTGGADLESDEAYRERIHNAPESFSVAGPTGAYEFWAKSANPSIIDVAVTSPSPSQVLIVPLLAGGAIPNQAVLDAVAAVCNDSRVRPLTDKVTVAAPTIVAYNINLTYYIRQADSPSASEIQTRVNAAVDAFVIWQKGKLGRDINPSELYRVVMQAGAYRVDVAAPAYAAVDTNKVAVIGTRTVTYGGLVSD